MPTPTPVGSVGSRTAGGRSTPQKRAVEAELAASDDFRSAQEIHEALRSGGTSIGLATVYRTLQTLSDAGEVDSVKTDAGEAAYRRCSRSHHHHLICRVCGYTVEIEGPAVERWATAQAEEHDFADVAHTVELFGVCAECRSAGRG
ncbi:MAG: transcriptional repressor [Nocardioides sp.]|nr:transcriptional repressor [Nocardioides sp.]